MGKKTDNILKGTAVITAIFLVVLIFVMGYLGETPAWMMWAIPIALIINQLVWWLATLNRSNENPNVYAAVQGVSPDQA